MHPCVLVHSGLVRHETVGVGLPLCPTLLCHKAVLWGARQRGWAGDSSDVCYAKPNFTVIQEAGTLIFILQIRKLREIK